MQLLDRGADINQATCDDFTTPLMLACIDGHETVARFLLDRGADINQAAADDGTTASASVQCFCRTRMNTLVHSPICRVWYRTALLRPFLPPKCG